MKQNATLIILLNDGQRFTFLYDTVSAAKQEAAKAIQQGAVIKDGNKIDYFPLHRIFLVTVEEGE